MEGTSFEQGPIRPPSEAGSLLLRFTRNCPWNKCTFCRVYKGTAFSRRSLPEIKHDIDSVAQIIEELDARSSAAERGTRAGRQVLAAVFSDPAYDHYYRQVAVWRYMGNGSVFIQDANSLMLPGGMLAEAIRYLKARIRGVGRITSYARSSTLARKSVSELTEIRQAGLDRIHIGMESGSDRVLEFVNKGTTARQHIEAGRKVIEAGMELSEYVMPGLGGKALSDEHAVESARVLNEIDPHFIRIRSLRIPSGAPLLADKESGRFVPLTDDEQVREIRLFMDSLQGIHSTVDSYHIINLLEEVVGKLPEDKEAMLAVIDRYLAFSPEDKLLFRLGRRGGALRTLGEFEEGRVHQRLESAMKELTSEPCSDVEQIITELADQYI
jgi:hypothetical protein